MKEKKFLNKLREQVITRTDNEQELMYSDITRKIENDEKKKLREKPKVWIRRCAIALCSVILMSVLIVPVVLNFQTKPTEPEYHFSDFDFDRMDVDSIEDLGNCYKYNLQLNGYTSQDIKKNVLKDTENVIYFNLKYKPIPQDLPNDLDIINLSVILNEKYTFSDDRAYEIGYNENKNSVKIFNNTIDYKESFEREKCKLYSKFQYSDYMYYIYTEFFTIDLIQGQTITGADRLTEIVKQLIIER